MDTNKAIAEKIAAELASYSRGAAVTVLLEDVTTPSGYGSGFVAYGKSAELLLPFIELGNPEVLHKEHGDFLAGVTHEVRVNSRGMCSLLDRVTTKHRVAIVAHDGWDKPYATVAVLRKQGAEQTSEQTSEWTSCLCSFRHGETCALCCPPKDAATVSLW